MNGYRGCQASHHGDEVLYPKPQPMIVECTHANEDGRENGFILHWMLFGDSIVNSVSNIAGQKRRLRREVCCAQNLTVTHQHFGPGTFSDFGDLGLG